jgi:hypothetical protein
MFEKVFINHEVVTLNLSLLPPNFIVWYLYEDQLQDFSLFIFREPSFGINHQ